MKTLVHRTIRGDYDPRDIERYESVSKNGIPLVATYLEPIRMYNEDYAGSVFCLKTKDSRESTVVGSSFGGSSTPKTGFSRRIGS